MGPIYSSDEESEPLLASAYRSSLQLANEHELKTIAFPAISCGVFGYPYAEAAKVGRRGAAAGACFQRRLGVALVACCLKLNFTGIGRCWEATGGN